MISKDKIGNRTGASSGTKSETSSSLKESSMKESIFSGGLLGRYQWYSQQDEARKSRASDCIKVDMKER